MPWQLRTIAKLAAARVNVLKRIAVGLGAFDHGPMLDATYVSFWVESHVHRSDLSDLDGLTVLELGPGDSIASALVARSLGAERVLLVDAEPFATRDVDAYRHLSAELRKTRPDVIDLARVRSFDELLDVLGASYLTDGLSSLQSLPSDSVDLSWSQAVLEHVRLDELPATVSELHRVHRVGTVSSHRVDLQDHLDRSLHNLRFRANLWESFVLRHADFYTNRLRKKEMLELFSEAGFDVTLVGERSWQRLPVKRSKLAAPYSSMSEKDLLTQEIDFLARKV